MSNLWIDFKRETLKKEVFMKWLKGLIYGKSNKYYLSEKDWKEFLENFSRVVEERDHLRRLLEKEKALK